MRFGMHELGTDDGQPKSNPQVLVNAETGQIRTSTRV